MEDKKPHKRRKWKIAALIVISVLIIARLVLPYFVLKYVNKTLAEIKGYYGHAEDIDLALIRGAYQINDLLLVKVDTVTNKKDTIPFFKTPQVDLSVEWRALFKGEVVGEIYLTDPVLNFVKGKHKDENVKQDTTDFNHVLDKLMPLTINHFNISNGQIHFRDPYASPVIDVPIKNIEVRAENLSNVNDSNKVLPATIKATGDVYAGKLSMNVKLNVMEKYPTFDLNASLDNVDLTNLNHFFKKYGKFEVEKGNFGMYTEFAAKESKFKGYVKPLIKDMKVAQDGNFAEIAWETFIQGAAKILENKKTEKVGTKVPIEGKFDDPNTGLWTAISYVLRNAFVFALQPEVDNEIDIGEVEEQPDQKKTFLQKVFGGKKEKKDKKEEEDKKDKNKKEEEERKK
jgi:hypothetical protein